MPASYITCITVLTVVVCPFTTRGISAELDLEVVVREHTHPYPACTTEELGRLQRVYHGQGADRVPMTMIGRDWEGCSYQTNTANPVFVVTPYFA
jgi:hypothetical protein